MKCVSLRAMLTHTEIVALKLSLQVALTAVAFSLPLAILVSWLLTRGRFIGSESFGTGGQSRIDARGVQRRRFEHNP